MNNILIRSVKSTPTTTCRGLLGEFQNVDEIKNLRIPKITKDGTQSIKLSYTFTPMLASRFLKEETEDKKKSFLDLFFTLFDRFYDGLDSIYKTTLGVALKIRWLVILIGMGSLFVALFFIVTHILVEFTPQHIRNQSAVVKNRFR